MYKTKDILLNTENYPFKTWSEEYKNNSGYSIDLKCLFISDSWTDFFKKEFKTNDWLLLEKYITHALSVSKGEVKIYPYPALIFSAFNATPLDKVKVVILGQDPYFKNEEHTKLIPQAMGLSFSVPIGIKIPSSLINIYKNLHKFGHISKIPNHGNLSFWAYQGCLMLNASLTVQHGHKNSHAKYWANITNSIIKHVSDTCQNIVFVLWGKFALKKLEDGLIDEKIHKVLISSHPSGLSNNKSMKSYIRNETYKSFSSADHFREINKYLKKCNKDEIIWEI
jgi:uracil-DNA glycosylase